MADRARVAAIAAGAGVAILTALAVVASRYADVADRSPLRPDGAWRPVWTWSLLGAFVLYCVGLLALRRPRVPLRAVVVIAAIVQLAPLAAPLLLSKDVYAYWNYARARPAHDANPYRDRPSAFPADPAFRRMGTDWRGKPTVYGPAFTAASEGVAASAGDSARAATGGFRLLAALGSLALVLAAAAATPRRAFAAAFVGWNPLLALHFAGGGHNDVLMAAALVAALALGRRGHVAAEGAAWAVSAAIKVVPLVLLPLRMLAARRDARRLVLGLAAGAAVIAVPAVVLYGLDWLRIFTPVANQLRQTSSLGLPYWLGQLGVPGRIARDGLLLAFVLVYAWLLWEAWRGRARLALAACALLLATSWLQPWYAVWAVPLAAVEEDRLARVLAVALSAYFLRDALPL